MTLAWWHEPVGDSNALYGYLRRSRGRQRTNAASVVARPKADERTLSPPWPPCASHIAGRHAGRAPCALARRPARSLPHRGGHRARRHGRRLPGHGHGPRPPGRAQAPDARLRGRRGLPDPLRRASRSWRPPSTTRTSCPSTRRARSTGSSSSPCATSRASTSRRASRRCPWRRGSRAIPGPGRLGARRRPRPGAGAPRREAGQHPHRARRVASGPTTPT